MLKLRLNYYYHNKSEVICNPGEASETPQGNPTYNVAMDWARLERSKDWHK